jgi:hypothetical protein
LFRTAFPALSVIGAAALACSCKGCDDPPTKADAAVRVEDASPEAAPAAAPSLTASAAPSSEADAEAAVAPTADAGASACRLVYGPAEQPFRGPATLMATARELSVIVNDMGKPRIYPVPIAAPPAKGTPPVAPARPSSFAGVWWPPCEIAGRFAYCAGHGGIVRTTLGGADSKVVAKSKPGTRIAAAPIGADHAVVAFLDSRYTSEGSMLQAFVALDDQQPVRLSDDGAGATAVRFLPRDPEPVAIYIDARTAMVPVHARPMTARGGELKLGADTVLFVGGAPERGVDFTVTQGGQVGFALLPIPRETIDFGMATIPIGEPPKEDVAAVWSLYPNGLDPAPITAAPARDGKGAWVARVRPREKKPGSPRVLELGRVDAVGAFSSLGEIATLGGGLKVSDLSLVEDPLGAVWIAYGDSSATWLERRVCGG